MNELHPIICDAIISKDGTVGRIACGLVSDLSNYFEKGMVQYANDVMKRLNHVLRGNDFETETKTHAMIAVGDICLAIEDQFLPFLKECMECLITASKVTLNPQNFENSELLVRLRDSIIDAFISMLHGIQPVC